MNQDFKENGQLGGDMTPNTVPAENSVELVDVKAFWETANKLHADIINDANTIIDEIKNLCKKNGT